MDNFESSTGTLRRSWSNMNLNLLQDETDNRYRRGSSVERCYSPDYCRGRSPSPYRERAGSLEPEPYEREGSPAREIVRYRRPYSDVPRYEIPRPYSDYYYCRPYSDFYYYDRPYPYYYRPAPPPVYPAYQPRPYYDYSNYYYRPSIPTYSYIRPSYERLAPETKRVIAETPSRLPEKRLTPRDQSSYSSVKPYESYSLSSPRYTKSFTTYTTSDSLVYNPAKYRSYFANPIKRGRTRELGELKKEGGDSAPEGSE